MKKLKILHAPTTVGGNPAGLARAEQSLGYESCTVAMSQNYFNYSADKVLSLRDENFFQRNFTVWKFFFWALSRYDVFHFNFGRSFAPIRTDPATEQHPRWKILLYSGFYSRFAELLDAKIASKMGRVVAFTYQGDDARQGDYCSANFSLTAATEVDESYYGKKSDDLKRKRIAKVGKIADLIYSVNPDLMHVLPPQTKFIPYASVDPQSWKPVWKETEPTVPHVVHAPSHRKVKGTKYVLEAFERLKEEGISFCYTLVEGVSHDEARKIYETADLVVDQLLIGWYGGLAVELMALGKPAICYIREEDMKFIPEEMHKDLPLIQATPDTIYQVLKEWLTTRKGELRERGKQSRAFVETWHDPIKIAKNLTADYERVWAQKQRQNTGG